MGLTLTQAKQAIGDVGRGELENLIRQYGEDVIEAAIECDVVVSDIEEAYHGKFNNDEEFVQQLVEDIGDIPKDLPGYIHINWERTARDVMMDYSESNGYYFRNL
jgi:antirestriction protein